MSLVLDSSITLAWLFPDETTAAVRDVFDRLARTGAWVPGLWRLEVANCLQLAARRGRIPASLPDQSFADLNLLPITVDNETERNAWGPTASLAASTSLTVYDASYLELALRRGLPLATLDRELRTAAQAKGVLVLGL